MKFARRTFAAIAALGLAACAHNGDLNTQWPVGDQGRTLMALAAREAVRIDDTDRRITRQLNLADQQRQLYGAVDAIVTLGEARQTLQGQGEKLKPHVLLSGWVSISQISRQADDAGLAKMACVEALERLHSLQGGALRCQYALGVANEVKHLLTATETSALLETAGTWAAEIGDLNERRRALQAFAVALFNLGRFDQGVNVLRNDPDAAWRSDALAMLAGSGRGADGVVGHQTKPAAQAPAACYGRELDYEHMFKGQSQSRTE